MKISKGFVYALFYGILIIAGVIVFNLYRAEISRTDEVNANLAAAQAVLPPLTASIAQSEKDLAAAQVSLTAAQKHLAEMKLKFPTYAQSIDFGVQLFLLAINNNLELVSFQAQEPGTWKDTNSLNWESISMRLTVKGSISDILAFLGTMEVGDYYRAITIDSSSITFPVSEDSTVILHPEAVINITASALKG